MKVKHLLLGMAFSLAGLNASVINAQDIITKTNGDEIQVKVTKITDTQIEYKKFSNINGPDYTINKKDVFMIRYENGEKEVITIQNAAANNQPKTLGSEWDNPFMTAAKFNAMDDDDVSDFLEKNEHGEIYDLFSSGMRNRRAGKALLGVGIGFAGVGLIFTITGAALGIDDYYSSYGYYYTGDGYGLYVTGLCFLGTGSGLIIASIPLSAVGGAKKSRAKEAYINQYLGGKQQSYQPTLNFGLTRGGIGLTLQF
ncbi:MAG: hypothetical protein LBR17_03470 [Bacteroidales bacterium]|jgi:hypothetical protein|nr:hypothetical protein [Bacteroidales bacterium]